MSRPVLSQSKWTIFLSNLNVHRTILTRFWAQSSSNLRQSSDELRDCWERFRVISPKEVRKRRRGFDDLRNTGGDRRYTTILFESGCSLHSYYNFITTLKTTMLLVNQNRVLLSCVWWYLIWRFSVLCRCGFVQLESICKTLHIQTNKCILANYDP